MSDVRSFFDAPYRRVRYRAQRFILNAPRLGVMYVDHRSGYEDWRITSATRLVIDGFPRSANSYAMQAFIQAQGDDNRVCAGHAHSPAILVRARHMKIPAMLVIREPAAAVASLLQFMPYLTPGLAISSYINFHRALLPSRHDLYVADFDLIVNDYGRVISDLNARYGAQFLPYVKTPEAEARVRVRLEEMDTHNNGGLLNERSVSRPSEYRRRPEEVLAGIPAREHRRLKQAEAIYQRFVNA